MQIPIDVIKAWPAPNRVNPITTGTGIIVMHAILFPIVLAVVSVRIFSRVKISHTFGWDDALILLALVGSYLIIISYPHSHIFQIPTTVFTVLTLVLLYYLHLDRHVWDILPTSIVPGLKMTFIAEIIFSAAGGLTRLSMLIMTRRIIATSQGALRTITNIAIGIIVAEHTSFILIMLLSCQPLSAQWTVSFEPQKCVNMEVFLLVAGILNTLSDFLVVLLPIPVVLKLQLPRRQLIVVTMLFGAGFLVCAAGGARTWFTYMLTSSFDATWYGYRASLSSSVELYIGIVSLFYLISLIHVRNLSFKSWMRVRCEAAKQ
jgi:hypothetical protein